MNVPIPCTDFMEDDRINGDYEIETGNQIVNTFSERKLDPAKVQMVLVAGHGPFTWTIYMGKRWSKRLEQCRTSRRTLQNGVFDGNDPSREFSFEGNIGPETF